MGIGAVLIFFGVALFTAQLIRPLAAVLGVPGDRLPAPRGSSPARTRSGTRSGPARRRPR